MKYKIKLKYKISTIPKVDIVLICIYFDTIQLIYHWYKGVLCNDKWIIEISRK